MDEITAKEKTRKTPGTAFFLAALFVYMFVVHGISILSVGYQPDIKASQLTSVAPDVATAALNGLLHITARVPFALETLAFLLLFSVMVILFHLTHQLVRGPLWLGSLAAAVFMAHPAKTEVLFNPTGLVQLAGALFALLALLSYLLQVDNPSVARYMLALVLFTLATAPFASNASLFCVLVMLEVYRGKPDNRDWIRQIPFLLVAIFSVGIHREVLYSDLSSPAANLAPLLLVLYPIGLLPQTVHQLQLNPATAWTWAALTALILVCLLRFVRNGAFRVSILALLVYRFYPGSEVVDLSSLHGGGQLLVPIALASLALAAFSRWLMQFEAWGKPVVAITTMLCMVLFTLQFQANRAHLMRPHLPEDTSVVADAHEGVDCA